MVVEQNISEFFQLYFIDNLCIYIEIHGNENMWHTMVDVNRHY